MTMGKVNATSFKITSIYVLMGGIWLLSDKWLFTIINDQQILSHFNTFKDWFYIISTAIMLHLLVHRNMRVLRQSEDQAYYDALTGLPNRIFFKDRIKHKLTYTHHGTQKLAIMILDLDRFKNVNDYLGHAIGDLLLQDVAGRLKGCFHDDDAVFHLGGDEYAVILSNIPHMQDVTRAAEKIVTALAQPFILEGHEIFITTSIGISIYSSDGEDRETLIKNAETAMYRAKEMNRDNYQFYSPEMNAKAVEQLSLENSLRKALGRKEFLLYYQPQVDIETGQIVGVEALLRWYRPDLGLISPADFIPLAEENGLIVPIGEWVLRTACEQNKAWQEAGFSPIRVSVNLSMRQFQQKNLAKTIARILKETDLDARWLKLEITESVVMHNAEETIATLHELKALGVHISIDDFGTGYSSLSYLKSFPIDTLKIDRSFVRDITTDTNDSAITKAVITLAHSLKLKVIAEGVETEGQLAYLRENQCDQMQGFLFSRPIPTTDFEKLLEKGQKALLVI
jgi:diguanylate cyclase (GGDEF)-like protein